MAPRRLPVAPRDAGHVHVGQWDGDMIEVSCVRCDQLWRLDPVSPRRQAEYDRHDHDRNPPLLDGPATGGG